jgi:PKD repeat protein
MVKFVSMLNTFKYPGLILIAAASLFTSCKKKSSEDTPSLPSASFTYDFTATNFAPSQVNFHNTSTNATSYHWSFGDGGESVAQEQSYTYNGAGDFTVTLTATNSDGSNSSSQTIHIANATIAKVTQVDLTQFPVRDGAGNPWDAGSGPDIYFKIFQNDTAHVTGNYVSQVQTDYTGTSLSLTLSTPCTVPSFTDTMYIAAFDKETAGPDTVMGKGVAPLVGFKMSNYTTTHPSTINIASSSDSLKYTLHITWQ